jgi:hypothetical protein
MKNEGGRGLVTVRRWFRTVALDVCCRFLFFNVFPFTFCKAHFIGNWDENSPPNTEHDHLTYNPPILMADTDAPCANIIYEPMHPAP